MGRKRKEDLEKEQEKKTSFVSALKKETTEGIIAIVFIIIAIFLCLAPLHKSGIVGEKTFSILTYLVGFGYYILPVILLVLGVSFIKSLSHNLAWPKMIGGAIFTLSGIGLIDLVFAGQGGLVGNLISKPLITLFDFWVSLVGLLGLIVISILVIFDLSIRESIIEKFLKKKELPIAPEVPKFTEQQDIKIELPKEEPKDKDDDVQIGKSPKTENQEAPGKQTGLIFLTKKSDHFREYVPPPLSLLERDSGKPVVGDIKANANVIKRTLSNFGIQVEMDEVSIGPSVTRYALKPAEGIKLSRIVGLKSDLSLALAAHPLRIEAPIPGKSLVGIEMPNTSKTKVGLGTLFRQDEFQNSPKPLLMGLGKGVTGQCHFADLTKMPHMLIAGTTGSGKSVTIHTLIQSLIFRNSPETLKFIMVDPKRVELTLYNKIPHLLTPVITDAKKTILSLKWAANEMSRRYDILESKGVRDINSYHKNVLAPALEQAKKAGSTDSDSLPETMPFIVIVIDELADIMQTYPRELEAGIVRLAQMSRAVGIHLIISTQRPSVNVITGLIKANIPARVALQVASQIDSRTILDMPGAENLLGAGDMLFLSADMAQPVRIQSAFISEEEVKNVVSHLVKSFENELPESNIDFEQQNTRVDIFDSISTSSGSSDNFGDDAEDDDMYEEAKEVVLSAGKASTSYLQRKLRIGYSRAARIMDILEQRGVIGASDGAKPREVLGGKTNEPTPEE